MKCPGRVCAALAAGSGGSGRCLVSCLPRFPLPAPRVLRCVWRTPRPGVPYPRSLVRHSMRSVRSAGSVRLPSRFSPRVLCVCVRSRSSGFRAPPLPPLVGVARVASAVPVLGAGRFHAVRAPPRGGGGGPVPFPPYLAWGCVFLAGWVCASRAFQRQGGGLGGWGAARAPFPPGRRASGAGNCLASVRPSAFLGQATQRVSLASLWPWRAWPPYSSGSCSLAVSGRGPCGALVCWRGFTCPSWLLREQAAAAWGRALLRRARATGQAGPCPWGTPGS